MRRILAQVRKELTQLVRDRMALALALLLPCTQLILMGTAISLTVSDLPIAVQDLDDSPASRTLIDAFRQSNTFRIVPFSVDRQPETAFTSNLARAALIIPAHFGRDIARGSGSPVQMLIDASDSNTARLLSGYAAEVTAAWNANNGGGARVAPVSAAIRFWYNPGRSSKKFYGPGIFVLGLSLFPPLLASLASAKEGEQKTILQVYVSSISAHEFLLGKILTFVAVCFLRKSPAAHAALHLLRPQFRGRSELFHRRHHFLCVLRLFVWNAGRLRHPQPAARHADGDAGRFSAGLYALRSDLSHPEHSHWDPLAFELHLGPVLHRYRARCASGRRWLARAVVEGAHHRFHRIGLLHHLLAQHAPHATESVTGHEKTSSILSQLSAPRGIAEGIRADAP